MVLALVLAPAMYVGAALDVDAPGERTGKLKPELVPNRKVGQTLDLHPASPEERTALPASLSPEDVVLAGATFFEKRGDLGLALVKPAAGEPFLFADVNRNGSFEANERFAFQGESHEVILQMPLNQGPYRYYPIRLFMPVRTLLRSPFAFVEGTVEIGGRKTLVRYMFDREKRGAFADYGWQGMDINGDGRIEESANQEEWTFAKDESIIYHVNGHDVSTVSLNLKAGTFLIREHAAGENQRISLREGESVPDFAFTDLDGKPHQFSEFRGKYVMLDFWGTWCGPCRKELPDLEKAYQQFRSRGFVVLGMDDDKDTEAARKVLAEAGATYPQSSGETGNALVYRRFRIGAFPTKALLDGEGKVVAMGYQGGLDHEHFAATLDKLLPPAK